MIRAAGDFASQQTAPGLKAKLLRKEEFFMFTYGTSDIAADPEVCII